MSSWTAKDKLEGKYKLEGTGRFSSLLALGLAGFGLGWAAESKWEDAQSGYIPDSVMRVRCLQIPDQKNPETNSEETAKDAFEKWTAFAARQKGFLSSRLYIQPDARNSTEGDLGEKFGDTKFLVLDTWLTATHQTAAAEAAAETHQREQGKERPGALPEGVSALGSGGEQKEASEAERARLQEQEPGAPLWNKNSGQVYVFDSLKNAPLWRVFATQAQPPGTA